MEYHQLTVKKNSFHPRNLIKIILIVFWGGFLAINTWTSNLERLLVFHTIHFKWVPSPNFLSFFYFNDFTTIHRYFVIVKLGHFTGFAIMDLLVLNLMQNHKASIGIAFSLAFFTEFLQLFLGRDGRLYDLIIDSLGILSVYLFGTRGQVPRPSPWIK